MGNIKGHLRAEDWGAETESRERIPSEAALIASRTLGQTSAPTKSDEIALSDDARSSSKTHSITLPTRHFIFLLIVFAAVGYVIGAAHQLAVLT